MFRKIRDQIKKEEIRRYIVVGILTTCIGYAVYFVLLSSVLDARQPVELQIANTISWIIGMLFSFFASKKYVFFDDGKKLLIKAFKFCSSRIIVMLIEGIQLFFYVNILGMNEKLMKFIAMGISIILNFCISKYMVFINK